MAETHATDRQHDDATRTPFGKDVILRVRSEIDTMPDALSRIGKYIVDNPEKAVRSSVAELALHSTSGEASVVRFCRHLGYDGFRDLKLALAADIAYRDHARAAHGGDPQSELGILEARLSDSIVATRKLLDPLSLRHAAERLLASRRIDIFGAGVSGIVAQMLAYRLLRLGLVAQAFQDPTLAHEITNGVDATSTAIGVSETGLTSDTVNFLAGHRAASAFTILLTARPNSPAASKADIVLHAAALSPPPTGGEVGASIAKIFLVEALAEAIQELRAS